MSGSIQSMSDTVRAQSGPLRADPGVMLSELKNGSSWHHQIRAWVDTELSAGATPRDVRAHLERLADGKDWPAGHTVPDEKTIRRCRNERNERLGMGEVWRLDAAPADEATVVLPVLGAVIDETSGRVATFTPAVAGLVTRIRAAAPDLDGWSCYLGAVEYATQGNDVARGLDAFLGIAPWRGVSSLNRYGQLLRGGLPAPPLHVLGAAIRAAAWHWGEGSVRWDGRRVVWAEAKHFNRWYTQVAAASGAAGRLADADGIPPVDLLYSALGGATGSVEEPE